MGDECKHLWQVFPPDGMAEGYWRCRFCGVTQDDPLELDPGPPPTDLPDAETAWPTWYHENIERLWELEGRERDEALFTAGFAAASGPWAEQLNAAPTQLTKDERSQMNCDCAEPYDWDDHTDGCLVPVAESIITARLSAALARNAELEAEVRRQEELRKTVRVKYRRQRDDARAELDNLRETLAQKVEAEMRRLQTGSESPEFDEGMAVAAEIVRGSDDE